MSLKDLARNAGTVAIGTGIGQFIIVASTPILARLYEPGAFGELAILLSVTNIAFAAACFRYEIAIPVCKPEELGPLVWLCTLCALAAGALAALACLLPWERLGSAAGASLARHPWVVFATVFCVGCFQTLSMHALTSANYRVQAGLRIFHGAVFSASAALPAIGLLWAQALGYAGALSLARVLRGLRFSAADLAQVASRYRKYPLFSLPGALLDIMAYSAAIWIVTEHFGLDSAGQVSQIQRLVGAPLMLIGIGLSQAILSRAAALHKQGEALRPLIRKVAALLGVLACCVVLAVYFIGEPIIGLMLGPGWRTDAFFLCAICSAVAARACVSPLSSMLLATERVGLTSLWQAGYFVSALTVLVWLAGRLPFDQFILAYALHELILYALYLGVIYFGVRK